MSTYLLCAGNKENKGRKQEGKNRRKFLYCKNNYLEALIWLSLVGQNITSLSYSHIAGADLGGGCRGCTPPPPPRYDLRFSNTTRILPKKKTMWSIGVEVEQETSAPPPEKNPGSAPVLAFYKDLILIVFLFLFQ